MGSGGWPVGAAADARCDAVCGVVCFGWLLFGHPLTSPAECAGAGRWDVRGEGLGEGDLGVFGRSSGWCSGCSVEEDGLELVELVEFIVCEGM